MGLFEYDYDDLAAQVQTGLERLAVSFLRGHGARVRKDLVDFHGNEQVELELSHEGQSLRIRQIKPASSAESGSQGASPGTLEEVFESTFNGYSSADVPREQIAHWLSTLPVGEAPPEVARPAVDKDNPFAAASSPSERRQAPDDTVNPFLAERSARSGPNPFVDAGRSQKREETLRRLRGGDDEER
jgi:hypothetical protein